jgi:hypothetical protein
MVFSTEPHCGEGSPLDATVSTALVCNFYSVKITKVKMTRKPFFTSLFSKQRYSLPAREIPQG